MHSTRLGVFAMRRIVLWIMIGFIVLLLAGCGQSIFVTPSPHSQEPEEVDDRFIPQPPPEGLDAPISPFPSTNARLVTLPEPPIASAQSYQPRLGPPPALPFGGVPGLAPLPAPAGPSFAWSETDNYLILGTDRRPGQTNWRTDTIMVLGLDRANNRAAVLSVPRDLYINIPGYGYGRINTADYIGEKVLGVEGGGPALISQILSENLGVSTNHWVRMEMTGFRSIVDAVGGVTVHLDCPFYEPIYNLDTDTWDYFTLPAGDVTLDGESAYWFVRLRLRSSDISRGQRQRQFLWALRDKALSTDVLGRLPELWTAFQQTFTTDLSLLQMLDLARFGFGLDASNVRATGLTMYDLQSYRTPGGAAVLIIADPVRVRSVVDSVWSAPAMVDAYRQDATNCPPLPPEVAAKLAADGGG
jgi:LCP family protein required for cell wall assembly